MTNSERIRTKIGRAWLSATIASLVCFSMVLAASGGLDTSFHGNGKLKWDIVAGQSNQIRGGVGIQSDGKIVAAGETYVSATKHNIAVTRFTKTGSLDTTFNGTGKKVTDLGGVDQVYALVIDKSTGKIVVAGQKCNGTITICDAAVLRYNPNGSLDTSFNHTGYRIDDYGGGDNGLFAVTLQSDGKIVAGGYMYNTTNKNYDFAVYRYTSAGALDTSFNGTGKKAIPFATGWDDDIVDMAIQPSDGKIVVGGRTCNINATNCDFALARLNPNGSLDTSFNGTGKKTTDLGGIDMGFGLALQSNGKIVLAGQKGTATSADFGVVRYNTNGTLDTSFAGTGKKVFDFSGSGLANYARDINIQPTTGKMVVCGISNNNFALARLTSAGTLDTTFNGTGKVSVDFGGSDICRGVATQPADGKYVLAGWSYDGSLYHSALARVLP